MSDEEWEVRYAKEEALRKEFSALMVTLSAKDFPRIAEIITAFRYDCETTHGMEDEVNERVLDIIAKQMDEPVSAELARATKTIRALDLGRWYA